MADREAVRAFVLAELEKSAARRGASMAGVAPDENLFNAGVIDSMGFLELVASVETEFGLEIDFSEMDPAEFTTLEGLVELCSPFKKSRQT
jgi:acyl carrier protein